MARARVRTARQRRTRSKAKPRPRPQRRPPSESDVREWSAVLVCACRIAFVCDVRGLWRGRGGAAGGSGCGGTHTREESPIAFENEQTRHVRTQTSLPVLQTSQPTRVRSTAPPRARPASRHSHSIQIPARCCTTPRGSITWAAASPQTHCSRECRCYLCRSSRRVHCGQRDSRPSQRPGRANGTRQWV